MKKTVNQIIFEHKARKSTTPNYPHLSWLDYKRQNKIVRYYPTFKMYLNYRYRCFANGFLPSGAGEDEEKAYQNLIQYLKERLSE